MEKYKEKQGIKLDSHVIAKNDEKQIIANLMVNSVWGKFDNCLNYLKQALLTTYRITWSCFSTEKRQLKMYHFVRDDVAQLQWSTSRWAALRTYLWRLSPQPKLTLIWCCEIDVCYILTQIQLNMCEHT